MEALEAIRTRTSVAKMTDAEPSREDIEQVIEAATHAPNHHLTEPWRFTVFTVEGRGKLGEALAEVAACEGREEATQRKAREKPFRAPVVILVSSRAGRDDVETLENRHAVAAAVQNMLLAAHALGLATIWRTGAPIYAEPIRPLLDAEDGETVVGAVYLGYAEGDPKPRKRTPWQRFAKWRDG